MSRLSNAEAAAAPGDLRSLGDELRAQGYAVAPNVFGPAEIKTLLATIEAAATAAGTSPGASPNFRRSQQVFAIRHLLEEVPALWPQLQTLGFRQLLATVFPAAVPHLVKAVYFDKPAGSNWLVAWHQDVMVGVTARQDHTGFGPWSQKNGEVTVRPPREILESIITLRLHLDDCDATNGALRVVPGSHGHGVISNEELPGFIPHAQCCAVPAGGVMLMQPLTLHASQRSTSRRPRRVVHLEFSAAELPAGLHWRERLAVA